MVQVVVSELCPWQGLVPGRMDLYMVCNQAAFKLRGCIHPSELTMCSESFARELPYLVGLKFVEESRVTVAENGYQISESHQGCCCVGPP